MKKRIRNNIDTYETRVTDTVALKKDVATERLISEIGAYLERLQGGLLGTPTKDDLQNAGLLHQFLERTLRKRG